jgi:hypothetical protein
MTTSGYDAKVVIAHVREWPIEEQLALVRALLQELAAKERSANHRLSVYDLAGIARTGPNVPSDEQVDAWLDERRMKEM